MWAAEIQPVYAPELRLNGVAAGGIPVDFTHNLHYVDGSSDWAGAIPAVGIGIARAYHVDLGPYLSPTGMQVVARQEKGCIDPAGYPGLTFEKMLRPQYQDWQKVPVFVRLFNDSILGRGRAPAEPLLMRVGNRGDGGDGVMIAKDVQQLAYEYCRRNVPVDFQTLNGDDHYGAAVPFEAAALAFLDARYAGTSPTSTCASISPGNALTPLPSAPSPTVPARLRLRRASVSPRRHGVLVSLMATGGTVHERDGGADPQPAGARPGCVLAGGRRPADHRPAGAQPDAGPWTVRAAGVRPPPAGLPSRPHGPPPVSPRVAGRPSERHGEDEGARRVQ